MERACRLCADGEGKNGLVKLRLRIKGSISYGSKVNADLPRKSQDGSGRDVDIIEVHRPRPSDVLNARASWVMQGLIQMKALRQLELEIEDAEVKIEAKLDFCIELGRVIGGVDVTLRGDPRTLSSASANATQLRKIVVCWSMLPLLMSEFLASSKL